MAGRERLRPCVIEWDDGNWAHFEEHGHCTKKQVEDVVSSACHDSRRKAQDDGTFIYFGLTCNGRYLCAVAAVTRFAPDDEPSKRRRAIVVERVRPITCWPMVGKALASYSAWRATRKAR
jgi:hypothetical protein